jgi:hypothetical protein
LGNFSRFRRPCPTYLIYLQSWMALVALTLFVPQCPFFVPLVQNAINRRIEARIRTMRHHAISSGRVDSELWAAAGTPKGVQKLQMALHAKAKAEAGYSLLRPV